MSKRSKIHSQIALTVVKRWNLRLQSVSSLFLFIVLCLFFEKFWSPLLSLLLKGPYPIRHPSSDHEGRLLECPHYSG